MTSPDQQEGAPSESPTDLVSIFLGPKGENAEVFEQLLLDAFRDHVFWRRNFHPEDGFIVQEIEKRSPAYERSISVLRQELLGLLAELKAGVPFFSPRYAGHMCSDLTMASLIGYFATMLYNPNNVAAEASPVTSRLELEVADQLAAMVGFDAARHWGHLTSGGTVANFEALWVARNVKYLPIAIHWAAAERGQRVPVQLPNGEPADIGDLDLWSLLNLTPAAVLDAADQFRDGFDEAGDATEILTRHSLGGLGYQEFGSRLQSEFGDTLPAAVVLVPSTAHYSWEKICRSLGLGSANLVHIPVDERFRMDPGALSEALHDLRNRRQPVAACISVIGTTEESAVDRLDQVLEVREMAAKDLGLAFHLHADAAYGGYAVAVTRARGGKRRTFAEAVADHRPACWPQKEVFTALQALEEVDSVTVDPHKLGFLPYPAGAILFNDRRARELVAVEAPYLFHRGASEWGYIGRYIFEGSKPGAAAAAVWLSHKVLPLDSSGYGRLVGQTARGAQALYRRLGETNWGEFTMVPLPEPDLNIVCFTVGHPELKTLEENNQFVTRIYEAMSVGQEAADRRAPEYFVTKTILGARSYGRSAVPLIEALGFSEHDYVATGGLGVIRCTVMDPFFAEPRGRTDHVAAFITTLKRVMMDLL